METNDEKTKLCYGCKKILSIKDFSVKKNGITKSRCLSCETIHQQSYHKNKTIKIGYCYKCFQDNGVFRMASFGLLIDKKRTHCSAHKTEEMVDLINLKRGCIICSDEGIFKQATFGLLSNNKKTHCSAHKTEEMVNLADIKRGCIICNDNGVFKHATFGLLSDNKKISCSAHKTEEMVNLINLKRGCIICSDESIFKQATFGLLSNNKKTHCSSHKTEEMVDLVNLKKGCIICNDDGIFKQATFGLLSDNKKTHCSSHKTEEMVDLVNLKKGCIICNDDGIFKHATFGLLINNKRTHCSVHKTEEMVDLAHLKEGCIICDDNGVFKQATFGLLSDNKKISCSAHKTEEMVDLAHLKQNCVICETEGVFKRASYGPLFCKKIHCATHKLSNEYLHNNPTCQECPNVPYFGDEKLDQIPQRCEDHKLNTDVDMIRKECSVCHRDFFMSENLDKCLTCLGWKSDKEYKRKEKKIRLLLLSLTNTLGKPDYDSQIKDGCSLKRPDFFYKDFNPFFHLICECDEFQHSKYTCGINGELMRLINIYENDSGGFPLCVIRFNPDPYYYGSNNNTKQIKAYRGREDKLKTVLLGLKNRTDFSYKIGIIYLYYDNFDEVKIEPLNYTTRRNTLIVTHKHPHSKNNIHKIIL